MKNVEDIYELSPMQQGMLFDSLTVNVPSMYRILLGYKLQGDIDVAAFRRAWQHVTRRHSVMRTSFHWDGLEKPLQVVHDDLQLPFDEVDWSGLSEREQDQRMREHVIEEQNRPSDLSSPPLMRLTLYRISESGYWFLWSAHHMLMEGWSISIVLKDVFTCYRAFTRDEVPELEPVVPYRSFIHWLQQQDGGAAEAYWRSQLRGFEAVTRLPADRSSESVHSPVGQFASEYVRLSEAVTEALDLFVRKHQLTVNSVVRAAWAVLLAHYSGEHDVVFGAIVSGRSAPIPGIESMVGMSVNILPVRVSIPEDKTLLSWIRAVHEQHLEMQAFEHCSLMQVKQWSDAQRGRPLFDTLLVFENWVGEVSLREWSDLFKLQDMRYAQVGQGYPITVEITPGSQLSLGFLYDERRFDAESIRRMARHFKMLLEAIPAAAERRVGDLPRLTADDRRLQLDQWSGAFRPAQCDSLVHQLIESQVHRTPDAEAVVDGDRRLTYRELNARANQLAHYLQSLGVGPDVIVGICMARSPDLVVALLATLKAGGAYVPLDPTYPAKRLELILREARVGMVLTDERLRDAMPVTEVPIIYVDSHHDRISEQSTEDLPAVTGQETLLYVLYTSGSTGTPKGVMVSHRNLVNAFCAWKDVYELGPATTSHLQMAGFSFDVFAGDLVRALCSGGKLVLVSRDVLLSPPDLYQLMVREQVNCAEFVPPVLRELIKYLQKTGQSLEFMRLLIVGSDSWYVSEHKRVRDYCGPQTRLIHSYGLTEATVDSTWFEGDVDDLPVSALVPIGRPFPGTKVYILDKNLQPLPIGVPGELYVSGAGVAAGYLNRPDLTAEKFITSPFTTGERLYRTGDLVRYLPNGDVELLGRIDQQVKVRGIRIEVGEIESVLVQHQQVEAAVVTAIEDPPGDRRLVAYVVPAEGYEPTATVLRSALRERLPESMVPSAFQFLAALPLSANGKVDRQRLPVPDGLGHANQDFVPPQTEVQRVVAAIWQELLGMEQVGLHDNFFDLGGHSLLLMRLQDRLREAFEREVPILELLEHPTVDSVARLLRRETEPVSLVEAPDGRASRQQAGRARLQNRLTRRVRTAGGGGGSP